MRSKIVQEGRKGPGSQVLAPILSPNPIGDVGFPVPFNGPDVTRCFSVNNDRPDRDRVISHDLSPVCIESLPIRRILGCESGHIGGDGVLLTR